MTSNAPFILGNYPREILIYDRVCVTAIIQLVTLSAYLQADDQTCKS